MSADSKNIWLHRYAVLTAAVTLPLIFIGGLVTSHDAALAVPDWPTSYGYNMFLFPWKKMVGGIFYEHTHRLVASTVGFMTIFLALGFGWIEKRAWVRNLAFAALVLVIVQGILGGLRVVMLMKGIAIFHACLAQAFFCLLSALALFTSAWWRRQEREPLRQDAWNLRRLSLGLTALIFLQLVVAATMRHTNSGLAIPDFPTMYGKWIPPLDAAQLDAVNQSRIWKWNLEPVAMWQIVLHLTHRILAFLIALVAVYGILRVRRGSGDPTVSSLLNKLALLVLVQIGLGISVIWTQKAADVATAHVAVGALILMTSVLWTLVCHRVFRPAGVLASVPDSDMMQSSTALRGVKP